MGNSNRYLSPTPRGQANVYASPSLCKCASLCCFDMNPSERRKGPDANLYFGTESKKYSKNSLILSFNFVKSEEEKCCEQSLKAGGFPLRDVTTLAGEFCKNLVRLIVVTLCCKNCDG